MLATSSLVIPWMIWRIFHAAKLQEHVLCTSLSLTGENHSTNGPQVPVPFVLNHCYVRSNVSDGFPIAPKWWTLRSLFWAQALEQLEQLKAMKVKEERIKDARRLLFMWNAFLFISFVFPSHGSGSLFQEWRKLLRTWHPDKNPDKATIDKLSVWIWNRVNFGLLLIWT